MAWNFLTFYSWTVKFVKNDKICCEAAFCLKVKKIYRKKKRPGPSAERVRKFRERLKTDPKVNKRAKMTLHRSPDYQRRLSQLAFRFNKDFQDDSYVGFPVRMIFASELQVNSILPIYGFGEKVQNRFSIGLVWDHLGFLIRMISYFWSTSHLDTSCHISLESVGLSVQEKMFKIDFQDWRPSCISDWHGFRCFLTYNHPDAFYQV